MVTALLGELRGVATAAALLAHYRERDGDRSKAILNPLDPGEESPADLRRVEDAAYGLRWRALAHGLRLNPARSLVPQLPLALLDDTADAQRVSDYEEAGRASTGFHGGSHFPPLLGSNPA